MAAIIASGIVADRMGRRTLLGLTAGAIAAFSGFAPLIAKLESPPMLPCSMRCFVTPIRIARLSRAE